MNDINNYSLTGREMLEHLKAIWELAEESCPGGLLLLSVHKDENEIRYMINNCAYPHSDDKGPDIATPIDIYYCEGVRETDCRTSVRTGSQ